MHSGMHILYISVGFYQCIAPDFRTRFHTQIPAHMQSSWHCLSQNGRLLPQAVTAPSRMHAKATKCLFTQALWHKIRHEACGVMKSIGPIRPMTADWCQQRERCEALDALEACNLSEWGSESNPHFYRFWITLRIIQGCWCFHTSQKRVLEAGYAMLLGSLTAKRWIFWIEKSSKSGIMNSDMGSATAATAQRQSCSKSKLGCTNVGLIDQIIKFIQLIVALQTQHFSLLKPSKSVSTLWKPGPHNTIAAPPRRAGLPSQVFVVYHTTWTGRPSCHILISHDVCRTSANFCASTTWSRPRR